MLGSIKDAAQGHFKIESRDGGGCGGWCVPDTPFKKVRVATMVDISLGRMRNGARRSS